MGSVRSSAALTLDFPVDNANLQRTIDKVDRLTQNGELSGAGLAQALGSIGAVMDTFAETAPPPTVAYTGAAGTITRFYSAVIEYPLAIDNPPRPFPYRNVNAMPGAPLQGRGVLGSDRVKRYSLKSAPASVANTATTLDASDYVTVTAPAYAGQVAGVTFALLALDATGALLYAVATGVAAGASAKDIGTLSIESAGPLPTHAEFAIVPAAAASATLTITGIGAFEPGGIVAVDVGNITAQYAPVAGDTDASVATALAAAITSAQPLVHAVATGANIAIAANASGSAGNLPIAVSSTNSTVSVSAPFALAGGTAGGPVYGPRTRVSGVAGV